MAPPELPSERPSATSALRVEHEQIGAWPVTVLTVRASDGAELSLSRLGASDGVPVVLVHGTYSTRGFWLSAKGVGLGAELAGRGFDVWIPELRGHGRSPKPPGYRYQTAEDHIRLDVPAIARFVTDARDRPVHFVGHSAGGLFVIGAQAAGWLAPERVRSLTTLGSQVHHAHGFLRSRALVALGGLTLTALGHLPAPRLGLGPEIEPAAEMLEFLRWKRRGGSWRTRSGQRYDDGLHRVVAPCLAFAGTADTGDPPAGCRALLERLGSRERRFVELGRAAGFETDYDHVGLVVSKAAAREVWPRIAAWLREVEASRPPGAADQDAPPDGRSPVVPSTG